jgi:hypothetical protein
MLLLKCVVNFVIVIVICYSLIATLFSAFSQKKFPIFFSKKPKYFMPKLVRSQFGGGGGGSRPAGLGGGDRDRTSCWGSHFCAPRCLPRVTKTVMYIVKIQIHLLLCCCNIFVVVVVCVLLLLLFVRCCCCCCWWCVVVVVVCA